MNQTVPAFNIILSFLYVGLSFLMFIIFKHHLQARSRQKQCLNKQRVDLVRNKINYKKIMIKSWIKKLSLGCILVSGLKTKYLLKQMMIISVFMCTCIKINRIIIWPVFLTLIILPASVLFMYLSSYIVSLYEKAKQQVNNKTANDIIQNNQQIKIKKIDILSQQKTKQNYLTGPVLLFTSTILLFNTIFFISKSVSNSGQLNLISVIIIIVMDQLVIRTIIGLQLFLLAIILDKYSNFKFTQNKILLILCREQIIEQQNQLLNQYQQNQERQKTSSPLKGANVQFVIEQIMNQGEIQVINMSHVEQISDQQTQEEPIRPSFQPQSILRKQKKQVQQCFFTTPQRQLFDNQSSQTILQTIINNKQNQSISFNKFTLQIQKCTDSIDNNIRYKENQDSIQNKMPNRHRVAKGKTNKRVLKISGTSPYLQYLPDMLKKVDKYKHNNLKNKKIL